jgi:hypothetical protein
MARRWDSDERGHGIGDAEPLAPGASELVAAFGNPTWVTEQPELHLLPHVEAWCRQDGRLAVTHAETDGGGEYALDLDWTGDARAGVGDVRAAAFALIGSFAETATYVRQRLTHRDDRDCLMSLQFEVGTGRLASDSSFEPHGHVVLIRIVVPAPVTHA